MVKIGKLQCPEANIKLFAPAVPIGLAYSVCLLSFCTIYTVHMRL